MLKYVVLCLSVSFTIAGLIKDDHSEPLKRSRRAAFNLPAGIEKIIPNVNTGFTCPGNGIYADTSNDCRLFHICLSYNDPLGEARMLHETFACGNQTRFNQFSMTCDHQDDGLPCGSSPDFFYLNNKIGTEEKLHTDDEAARYAAYLDNKPPNFGPFYNNFYMCNIELKDRNVQNVQTLFAWM